MTDEEYDAAFPIVFNEDINADHKYNLEARRYPSGVGVTITQVFPQSDIGAGLCFDLTLEGLRAIVPSLVELASKPL